MKGLIGRCQGARVAIRPALVILAASVVLPACADGPTQPSPPSLTGRWTGLSTYPNAPFTLELMQTGGSLRGDYRDELDRSLAVTGTYSPPTFAIVVDLGDATLNLEGTVMTARTAQGTMFTSARGNTPFVETNIVTVKYRENGKDETVDVDLTAKTEVTRDKKAIARAQLRPGVHVVVDALGCEDKYEAVAIRIVPPPTAGR
jgi:hypothetical protein